MMVLLDNGHGSDTPGKRSPDGALLEWQYCRRVVKAIAERLSSAGVKYALLCPEENDVSLTERVRRANKYCQKEKCILISVHLNAFGKGKKWEGARGWSVFVNTRCSEQSKKLGDIFAISAEEYGYSVRRQYAKCGYWLQSLYILGHSNCPAVLTENLFMDNRKDVEILQSNEGFEKIVGLHFSAISKYIQRYGN